MECGIHEETGRGDDKGTVEMLILDMDARKAREFLDVVLEENGENQMNRQSKKRWGATKSRRGKKDHYYQEESELD